MPRVAVVDVARPVRDATTLRWMLARLSAQADAVVVVDRARALADAASVADGVHVVADGDAARDLARALEPDAVLLADDDWIGPLSDAWPAGDSARLVDDERSWVVVRGDALGAWLVDGDAPRASGGIVAEDALAAVEAGAPIVHRDVVLRDPLEADAEGLSTATLVRELADRGLDVDALAASLAGEAPPRALQTALGLVSVLSDDPVVQPTSLRVLVVAHVFYPDMLPELAARIAGLGPHRLVVTTFGAERGVELERGLEALDVAGEVRVMPSNRGRDISAFLLGCRDLLTSGEVDVVVKVHSKRSPQVGGTAGRAFKRLLLDNLLGSGGHAQRMLGLFAESPRLGLVVPPMVHSWYGTLGRAWYTNRPRAIEVARRAGIRVPLDDDSPVAPYGSMFAARPEALAPLVEAGFDWDEFPTEGEYKDGSLAHVIERLFAPAAQERGYAVRTVLSAAEAARSHALLEHKLDVAEASLERVVARKVARIPWKARRVRDRLLGRRRAGDP
ncbi:MULTISPECIES: rhamnan synthesis F family protein [unclassified Agrococcus]|uniref:rhamnan synthesis F family protein n=1 Tax=unclassified Agrococcus TaxID=2615065 RepID=UPI003607CA5C